MTNLIDLSAPAPGSDPFVELSQVWLKFPMNLDDNRSLKLAIFKTLRKSLALREFSAREALKSITLKANAGDRIAVLGRNGAGKTTLLRMIAGIYEPDIGYIRRFGSIFPLLDIGLGMDMNLSGIENIFMRGRYLGFGPETMEEHVEDIVNFCELGDDIFAPVKIYSSGMVARLSFAIATSIQADIYVMDEWIGAGDARFFARADSRLKKWITDDSILFLGTHSDPLALGWCNKAIVIEKGQVSKTMPVEDAIALRNEIMLKSPIDP